MFPKWIKTRKFLVAIGVVVVSWASFQSEGQASGEFLTDRIGQGSILRVSQSLGSDITAMNGSLLFFQDGKPVSLAQINVEKPYCKFQSTDHSISERFAANPNLLVRFKSVASAHWFFENGVQLQCNGPMDRDGHESVYESDFNQVLGQYFQIEKHSNGYPSGPNWKV